MGPAQGKGGCLINTSICPNMNRIVPTVLRDKRKRLTLRSICADLSFDPEGPENTKTRTNSSRYQSESLWPQSATSLSNWVPTVSLKI